MDEFARRADDDRLAFINEAAARRDVTPIIIEKDFWPTALVRYKYDGQNLGQGDIYALPKDIGPLALISSFIKVSRADNGSPFAPSIGDKSNAQRDHRQT